MSKSTIILYTIAAFIIIGAGIYLGMYQSSPSTPPTPSVSPSVSATSTPSVSPTATPTATSAPLGSTYTNSSLGLSFQYPSGYFVIEDSSNNRLEIQNQSTQLSGIPPATYRDIELEYRTAALNENLAKNQKDVKETDITANGATIRLYSFPNPNNAAWTITEAFWTGKVPFSMQILWNRSDGSSVTQGSQEADEVALMKLILPTVTVTR